MINVFICNKSFFRLCTLGLFVVVTVQLDCITIEYLPDDLLPAIDSVQCWIATELATMAFFSLLCWSAAIMAMLANSQSREPDGENQGEIPESHLMETSEPACRDRDGFKRLIGDKWQEDCNTCTCIKTQTGVGASCTEMDCNPGIGRQCIDEENLIREHLESWQQVRPGFKTVKEIADDAQLVHVNDLLIKIQLGSLEDVIVLTLASPMPGQTVPCLFSGKLGQDDDSLVTVVGCKDDEEVIVRIASRKLISKDQTADFVISGGKTYRVQVIRSFERLTCTCTDGKIGCKMEIPGWGSRKE